MYRLVWDKHFRRAFKKVSKNDPSLQRKILSVIEKLIDNPFYPELKTHKLSGKLDGLLSCWVEYDCRIIFSITTNTKTNESFIILLNIGSHDEVY